jgi:hypothetical protein
LIIQDPAVKQIAGFQDGESLVFPIATYSQHYPEAVSLCAPRLYTHISNILELKQDLLSNIPPNFENSRFMHVRINFGPYAVSPIHRQYAAATHSFTAITALGSFDHNKGRHIILPDIGIFLELPAGDTLITPTGIFQLGTTPVCLHEERLVFTQYHEGRTLHALEQVPEDLTDDGMIVIRNPSEHSSKHCKAVIDRLPLPELLTIDWDKDGLSYVLDSDED